jgi:hypothetical protein
MSETTTLMMTEAAALVTIAIVLLAIGGCALGYVLGRLLSKLYEIDDS